MSYTFLAETKRSLKLEVRHFIVEHGTGSGFKPPPTPYNRFLFTMS